MGVDHNIDIGATFKSTLEEASATAVDNALEKIAKDREAKINVDADTSKAKKKIDDLSKDTEKQSKKVSKQLKSETDSYKRNIEERTKSESQLSKNVQASRKKQAQELKELNSIKNKAKDAVSEENVLSSNAKRKSRLDNYAGQSSEQLSNAKLWYKEIEESQNRLSSLISSGASLKQIAAEFSNLTSATKEFNNSMSVVESTMEKSLSVNSLEKAKQNILDIKNAFSNVLTEAQIGKLDDLSSKYTLGLTSSGKVNLDAEVSNIKKQAQALKDVAKIRQEAESGVFEVRNARMDNTASKYVGQNSEAIVKLRADAEAVKNAQKELTNSLNSENVDADRVKANYEQLSVALEKYGNSLKVVKEIETTSLREGEAMNASNKVGTYINNNTKAIKKYGFELKNIQEAYKNIQTVGEKNKLDVEFRNLRSKISAEGLSGMSRFDDIKRAFSQISQFAGIYSIAQNLMQDIPRQVISAVTDVNAAQIELTKVSDASGGQLSQYWNQAAESAKKYGATVSDVISSTADWSKLGYDLNKAKKLSDATTLYEVVGDNMTQETASQSLVSTLQGFNMQADQAVSIVDKFNEVANHYAIGSDGIGEALQRSAASFNAAHTDLSKSIALITGTRLYKLVQYMETYIKNIFNCHRSLYCYTPQYRRNYCMKV